MSFRSGRLPVRMDREAAEYTSSISFDYEIFKQVIVINATHLKMLSRLGLIELPVLSRALEALKDMFYNPPAGLEPTLEDVHIIVEEVLAEHVPEAAGNLSFAKSRNDAVATAVRMRVKERIISTMLSSLGLIESMLSLADREAETIFPVYTHMQIAAPATFGFVMASHASRLLGGVNSLRLAYLEVDRCPLGSAAVTGSSIRLDRKWLAEQLGFGRVLENALEASSSRDFFVDVLCALLRIALALSDLSEELVIYSSTEFSLIDFPEEFASTSSLMPHKKNAVVPEVARTKVAEVLGEVVRSMSIISRRFSGYVLDLQQTTPSLWRSFKEVDSTISIYRRLIPYLRVNVERAYELCRPPAGIVELANVLALRYGLTFREAHKICGRIARLMQRSDLTDNSLREVLAEGGVLNLSVEDFKALLEPRRIVMSYETLGSSNPSEVKRMVREMGSEVRSLKRWAMSEEDRLRLINERAFRND